RSSYPPDSPEHLHVVPIAGIFVVVALEHRDLVLGDDREHLLDGFDGFIPRRGGFCLLTELFEVLTRRVAVGVERSPLRIQRCDGPRRIVRPVTEPEREHQVPRVLPYRLVPWSVVVRRRMDLPFGTVADRFAHTLRGVV